MKTLNYLVVMAGLVMAASALASLPTPVPADNSTPNWVQTGEIKDSVDAGTKCPTVCSAYHDHIWDGRWTVGAKSTMKRVNGKWTEQISTTGDCSCQAKAGAQTVKSTPIQGIGRRTAAPYTGPVGPVASDEE
ncbi:TPA: hypothetical protein DDZ86_04145 [Candidatus Dependentiae bacterium]|nr:MAG: hypothetical protein UW09_C0003G0177 [candidate division TM6 bacterium GW2011_GWF2_43_87]HBL98805.1 hypothetical protein [Candidatus Dependentiae bacterium]